MPPASVALLSDADKRDALLRHRRRDRGGRTRDRRRERRRPRARTRHRALRGAAGSAAPRSSRASAPSPPRCARSRRCPTRSGACSTSAPSPNGVAADQGLGAVRRGRVDLRGAPQRDGRHRRARAALRQRRRAARRLGRRAHQRRARPRHARSPGRAAGSTRRPSRRSTTSVATAPRALMQARGIVDVLVPRGSAAADRDGRDRVLGARHRDGRRRRAHRPRRDAHRSTGRATSS